MNNSAILTQNEWIIRQYFEEVWNKGNIDLLDTLAAPGYINHSSSIENPVPGPGGVKLIVLAMRQAFPDLHYEIEDLIINPEHVVARVIMSGTHKGDFFGIAPTNKKVCVKQINIERITDGRIVEHWRLTDELSLMKQLELIKV